MRRSWDLMAIACLLLWLLAGCGETKGDPKAEAPPQTKVEHEEDVNVVQTDRNGSAGRCPHRASGFTRNRSRC
jgi:hypothetical protein